MSDTWQVIAVDSLKAAGELHRNGRHRSAASRAYFAAFAAVAGRLEGVTFRDDRESPPHGEGLRKLVKSNMPSLQVKQRREVLQLLHSLYEGRLIADYHYSRSVYPVDAANYVLQANQVINLLGVLS